MTKKFNNGFSLVELSIVLVILGLLTGGVIAGRSMIRASELRSVTVELDQYVTATLTFKQKYFYLPGDMPNATRFWGDNATYCADAAIPNGSPGTCNGDGNGTILDSGSASTASEMFMFWNQLTLAGLIEGQYTGISGTGDAWSTVYDVNTPTSKLTDAGWQVLSKNYTAGDGWLYAYNYKNMLIVGKGNNGLFAGGQTLTPMEAWNIDKKIDDGIGGKGKVIAMNWQYGCTDATAYNDFDSDYQVNDENVLCSLMFNKLP